MGEHIRLIIVLLLWFSLTWGMGVMSHIGFKNNPRQRKILLGKSLTRILTWGVVEGDVAVIPILVQLNALVFLIWGIVEYILTGFARPAGAITAWFIGAVLSALLTPLMNQQEKG